MGSRTGPSLPRSLLDELDQISGSGIGKSGGNRKLSRKQARKQERDGKKQRKAEFSNGARPQHKTEGKRLADEEHVDSLSRKKRRLSSNAPQAFVKVIHATSPKSMVESKPSSRVAKKKTPVPDKLEGRSEKVRVAKSTSKTPLQRLAERTGADHHSSRHVDPLAIGRSQGEKEEDAYIAYLEKKLGWSKGGTRTKKYGSGLDEDGLDDILKDIDTIEASIFSSKKGDLGADSDDNEEETSEDMPRLDEEEDAHTEVDYSGVEEEVIAGDMEFEMPSSDDEEDEWTGFGNSTTIDEGEADGGRIEEPVAGTRYVPPHMRNRASDDDGQASEEQIKLTRQLKGLLNRMSEQNISTILDSVEELYRKHRRHDVTSSLTTLIIDNISSHSMLLDNYVVLHAAIVSSLHKLIGVEFAAYFVQNVVASYERHFRSFQEPTSSNIADDEDNRGKECSNLIVLLSELYNFQVISCVLVYDIIRGLLEGDLTEFKVELLLKITRNSGQQLRTDDPSALKDIIQVVHSRAPQQTTTSSRTRFMMETLTNLKNNKLKKDAIGNEGVERMKKFLSGLEKKRQVRSHEPLRVTLDDLHSAENKGKWWLVGAAWSGNPLVDRQEEVREIQKTDVENTLVKLARKQGMNTDIRRSIFVVLMSSEDYVDACERLSQLKLSEVQQREIIRVILHCCGNEKSYNPYYAFVGQQLCRTSHSFKITLQFCLWDFLRSLGETSVGGTEMLKHLQDDAEASFDVAEISSTRLKNVARAYAWWLAKDSCSLTILKPVDFTVLKRQTRTFFVELFTHLFVSTQLSTPLLSLHAKDYPATRNRGPLEEVFAKAARIQALSLGLVFFIGEHFQRDKEQGGDTAFLAWSAKVATETLRTGADLLAGL